MGSATSDLVKALTPLFAAGFAVQQVLEVLDPLLSAALAEGMKKIALKLIAACVGLGFALLGHLRVFEPLGSSTVAWYVDAFATALIVSGGTEGTNSILKFLGYAKEERKANAGLAKGAATPQQQNAIKEIART